MMASGAISVRSIQLLRSEKGRSDSFMESQVFGSARQTPAKRFMEDASICTNPPDISTMIRAKRLVCILIPHEGEETQIALLHELDETLEDITGVIHPICHSRLRKPHFKAILQNTLTVPLNRDL
jgi:hypothetical protein